MREFLTNRSIYHAKTGNFTGFCVSMPLDLHEEDLYSLFTDIRSNLFESEEEKDAWFTLEEFREYCNNPENILSNLVEVATTATRLKLRRAAKRSSKRRSRKRFMRRKIRKNQTQLKKRAYGQVKTMLRKRLSGGRPWADISFATRARIDASINRRKSILVRMVKNRVPKMPAQETKRLQRVRLNSSFEPVSDNLILETKRGPSAKGSLAQDSETKKKKTEGARGRQRKHRQKAKDSMMEFIKDVVVVKNGEKFELVERSSLTSNHTDRQELTSIGAALSVCKKREDGNFQQTKTSKKLCGVLEDLPKTLKKTKGNNQMASSTNSNNNAGNEEFPIQPEIPYGEQPGDPKDLPKMFRDFKINEEYKPEALELGITLVSRMTRSGNSQILEDIEDIQILLENTEDLTNDDIDMIDDIHERLMKSGLEEKNIAFLVSNKNLYTVSKGQYDSAFMEQDATGNFTYRRLEGFGLGGQDTADNYGFVQMGRNSVGVVGVDLDGTSKSDMIAVHLPTLLAFLGKNKETLSETEINKLVVDHITKMNFATGGSANKKKRTSALSYNENFQNWINSNTSDEAYDMREYRKNNLSGTFQYGAYEGFSIKQGPSRIASSNVSGDGANTLTKALSNILSNLNEEDSRSDGVIELQKTMDTLLDLTRTGKITATTITSTGQAGLDNAQPSVTAVEETKQKLISLIENITSAESLAKNKFARNFIKEVLRISLTGDGRINSNSPGIANHLFSSDSKTSPTASVIRIDDKLLEALVNELGKGKGGTDLLINFTLKSGSISSKSEKEYEKRFDAHVEEIQKVLRSGKSIGNLTPKDQNNRGIIEDEIVSNIFDAYEELDNLYSGDRDALIEQYKKEGLDPKDITGKMYLIQNDIRDKRYNIRIVLNIINNIQNLSGKVKQLQTQTFSFNPLLSFLVEYYSEVKEQNETEQQPQTQPEQTVDSLRGELSTYIDKAKRWIGSGPDMLGKLMRFFEIDLGVFTDQIKFHDIVQKTTTYGNTNSIFINKKETKIPVSEYSMSDYYKTIGFTFLSEAKKRDYTKDTEYESSPKQRHNRVKRVLARRMMEKRGLVHKGDGKDVDHKDGDPTNNSPKNLRVMIKSKNRAKH